MRAERGVGPESITIGIPAFNEQENIANAVQEALAVGRSTGADLEVLVVDDASRDETPRILADLAVLHPEVRVVRNDRNRGIGGSIAILCAEARKELLFLNAADGQWRMTELIPMREALVTQALDLVIGARVRKQYTPYRNGVSRFFRLCCERLFGFELWDPGSIILMRMPVRQLPLRSSGVFAHAELIIRAQALGYRAGRVDVEHLPRLSGVSQGASFTNILLAVRECARFYLEFRRSRSGSTLGPVKQLPQR